MKIEGQALSVRATKDVILPRPDGNHIVLKVAAVLDTSEFERLVKRPRPPVIVRKGKPSRPNYDNPKYRKALERYEALTAAWLGIQSLKATPSLEWETIKDDNPETWMNVENEMDAAGFSIGDQKIIAEAVLEVNSLSQKHITEAAESFFTEDPEDSIP